MHSLDWLRDQCHELTAPVLPSMPTVRLDDDRAVDPALAAMVEYFGQDTTHKAVQVVIAGKPAGFFERTDMYALFEPRNRGVGTSTYSGMAGISTGYEGLLLRCPVEGCAQMVFAFTLDVGEKVFCDVHPEAEMERTP